MCPHEPALRRWLSGRIQHGLQIDDVIQETYAKLASLAAVDHIENPRAYFFRAALSVVASELRRAPVVSMETLSEVERLNFAADDLPPDIQAEQREEFRLVADAIDLLPARCREAFMLRKVQGLSQRETAQLLGLSESTVEKHVGRGIRHLINIFGRGGKSGQPASYDQIPDTEHYDSKGKQRADRATGGHMGGPS
ncbi:sigma-70 family RNA polymerase sigma factor [Sphingobium sp. 10 DY56-G10]|uniref:RNA polymerase sigma factor n=1 Tax=Sphingomonas sp. (strain SKA58) TaxID=314266 RepID=UPI0022B543B7|nr:MULTISPECIES: sigma-70 family RNA polymerase sigma factor [Sphingomonadaceae]